MYTVVLEDPSSPTVTASPLTTEPRLLIGKSLALGVTSPRDGTRTGKSEAIYVSYRFRSIRRWSYSVVSEITGHHLGTLLGLQDMGILNCC